MIISTPVDITGDGAAHTLASILGAPSACKWFQFTGLSIGSTPGRVGDSTVDLAGIGIPITAGNAQVAPPIALSDDFYDLTKIYYILTSGDTASFAGGI